jgi:hypothetical protein
MDVLLDREIDGALIETFGMCMPWKGLVGANASHGFRREKVIVYVDREEERTRGNPVFEFVLTEVR